MILLKTARGHICLFVFCYKSWMHLSGLVEDTRRYLLSRWSGKAPVDQSSQRAHIDKAGREAAATAKLSRAPTSSHDFAHVAKAQLANQSPSQTWTRGTA